MKDTISKTGRCWLPSCTLTSAARRTFEPWRHHFFILAVTTAKAPPGPYEGFVSGQSCGHGDPWHPSIGRHSISGDGCRTQYEVKCRRSEQAGRRRSFEGRRRPAVQNGGATSTCVRCARAPRLLENWLWHSTRDRATDENRLCTRRGGDECRLSFYALHVVFELSRIRETIINCFTVKRFQ